MAVDANVLIYERIREESAAGKSMRGALAAGYDKAFSTIFDSNLTTLISSVILIYMGTGPVKGFGVTLTIGVTVRDDNGNLGAGIAGTQVTFNGIPAPMLYTSAFVMAAIVPFEIAGMTQTTVRVANGGSLSAAGTFPVSASAPGIFTLDSSGSGQAAALNEDFSVNSEANPAAEGSVIVLYATGGGQTNPPVGTGSTAQGPAQVPASVSATIGGQPAQVLYAGQAPDEVAGVMQVNLQVPNGVSGVVPVALTVGDVTSQTTAMVAVQ